MKKLYLWKYMKVRIIIKLIESIFLLIFIASAVLSGCTPGDPTGTSSYSTAALPAQGNKVVVAEIFTGEW